MTEDGEMYVAASTIYVILTIAAFVLAVVWLILPFAIFGTKPRLDRQTEALDDMARTLRRIEAITAGNQIVACSQCGDRILAAAQRCPSCDTARSSSTSRAAPTAG